MPAANLLKDRYRPDARCSLQHRHDLAVPDPGERVRTAASARLLLLRRQPRISFDPIGGRGGKPSLRGCDGWGIALTGLHVQPHLAVGDMSARQALILLMTKNHMLCPTAPTARPASDPVGKTHAGDRLTSGNVGPPSANPGAILILFVARFSP